EMSKSSVRKKCSFTIESILSSLPASYSAEVQLKYIVDSAVKPVPPQQQQKLSPGCCSTGASIEPVHRWDGEMFLLTQYTWPRRLLPPILRAVEPHTPVRSTDPQVLHQIQRRTRRHRTIFTEGQLEALETLFHQNQYPDIITREQLAVQIQLREERVEV
uniref:Goosecoid homeobox 2 n=1 Tax=Latimeria chalumnae TaxID=7897 RepID=H3AE12_LATCH